jgi:UDP-N-acetylglucosamine--N-acetylmuramyl-(pentapeptide) pyrophosphoryl-undecaprenol N-acetylglucosamine transferase
MKIVLATGGSGGHIIPALAVAVEFQKKGHDVHFIGPLDGWQPRIEQSGCRVSLVPGKGFKTENIKSVLCSVRSMIESIVFSWRLLRSIKPHAVVGFGGFGSFAVVICAILLRRATVIHEQNVVPGRANRWLCRGVDRVAVSFQETCRDFPLTKTVLTGCPFLSNCQTQASPETVRWPGFSSGRCTLLLLGGSQGSRRLNEVFLETLALLKEYLDVQVVHVAGYRDYAAVCRAYERQAVAHSVFDFCQDMPRAYRAADIVVSRAGAVTIFELAYWNLPAILIPYPYAQGHQRYNAQWLASQGQGVILQEQDLTPERLKEQILELWRQGGNRPRSKTVNPAAVRLDAAQRIADLTLSLLQEHGPVP